MADFRNLFINALSMACQRGVKHGWLVVNRDLRDVQSRIFEIHRTPQDMAAMALDQLCLGDRSVADETVVHAMVLFLNIAAQDIGLDSDRIACYKILVDTIDNQDNGYDELHKVVRQIWP